jgi:hypothetical protein
MQTRLRIVGSVPRAVPTVASTCVQRSLPLAVLIRRISVAVFVPWILGAFACAPALAQTISVSPSDVTAYSQGATSALLTYGGLSNKRAAEATWCGELIPAAPDLGSKCDPATIFGRLPARYDQSKFSGTNAYTDVMSITPQVARRAYLDAARGNPSDFFYVRRFVSAAGGPDEFVPVTIHLSGNGAGTPLSLTEVKLSWGVGKPVLFVNPADTLPRITAEISYTGTGRLKGRWELVKPGETLPEPRDLLTEAALPIEERGRQRRYIEMSRFNVYLPPTGKIILPGPEALRVDETLYGLYLVLLRIEASDDKEGDTDLGAAGAGNGIVHGGAVAGFPMPVLRYYVGTGSTSNSIIASNSILIQSFPEERALLPIDRPIEFSWLLLKGAGLYRLEITDLAGNIVLSAMVLGESGAYRSPPWLKERARSGLLQWRVIAFDNRGAQIDATDWRAFKLGAEK